MSLDNKIEIYRQMQNQLRELKEREMDLRLDICDDLEIDQVATGTHNTEFSALGLKVKMVKKVNHKLDKDVLAQIYDDLSEEEAECITFEPKMSLAKYKKAGGSDLLDTAITIVPATPTLTIELME